MPTTLVFRKKGKRLTMPPVVDKNLIDKLFTRKPWRRPQLAPFPLLPALAISAYASGGKEGS